jgi:hypothetical protein
MEPRKQNQQKTLLEVMELEDRITPTVAINVLELATVDVHLDLQANVSTPVGVNVDLSLTL